MLRVFKFAHDDTTCLDWSSDSRMLAVGSKDMSVKIYAMDKFKNFSACSLGSHKGTIVGVFFEKDSLDLTTVSQDGMLCVWESNVDPEDLVVETVTPKRAKRVEDSDSEDDLPKNSVENPLEGDGDDLKTDVIPVTEKVFYKRLSRHFLCDNLRKEDRNVSLTSAAYHKDSHVLVTGYSTGAFFIHELPSVNIIHSLRFVL